MVRWLALALLLCQPLVPSPVRAQDLPGSPIHEIVTAPERFDGQIVSVMGYFERSLGPRVFTLGDDDLLYDASILVVADRPRLGLDAEQADLSLLGTGRVAPTLHVTGPVRQFDLVVVEQELGLDLDDVLLAAWAGRPFVVARSIVRVTPTFAAAYRVGQWGIPADRILDDPALFYGRRVTVTGDLDDWLGPQAFTLEDADVLFDEEMLVVSTRPILGQAGRVVPVEDAVAGLIWVTGTVRPFSRTEVEGELGLVLDDARFADWEGRPVILAESILPRSPWIMPPSVTIERIAGEPASIAGQIVAVAGNVTRVFGPRAFLIEDIDLLSDAEVLVIADRPLQLGDGRPSEIDRLADNPVRIVGTADVLDRVVFVDRLGLSPDDPALAAWEGRPVIIARSILPWSPTITPYPTSGGPPLITEAGVTPQANVDDVLDDLIAYYGQVVTVHGDVDEVLGPQALVIEDYDFLAEDRMLVLVGEPAASVLTLRATTDGLNEQAVAVTGIIRQFGLADIEREVGYGLDERLYAEWEGSPVIIATSIRLGPAYPAP